MSSIAGLARGAVVALFAARFLYAGAAADLSARIADAELNPEECYRVRDVALSKEDVRFFFTDGYLMFGKPVGDAPISAVFVTSVQGGDAEVLALPPNRSERQALSSFTNSPNLNEHFQATVLLFTDDTYRELIAQIRDGSTNQKTPEMGLALAPEWNTVIRNLLASFESRLVLDLLTGRRDQGVFFATMRGVKLGAFDVIYDRRARQQITIGKTAYRNNLVFFDIWTTFESRSIRNGARPAPKPEFDLNDFRIDATLVPPGLGLQVTTRVKVKLTGGAVSALPFDLSRRMRVTSVTVDGQSAEVFERESMRANLIHDSGDYLLLVIPQKPLEPGQDHELEFKHEGAVIFDAGNKVYVVGSRANWYPNRGTQFANFDATFRYPRDLDLVSSGEIVSDTTEGDNRITRRKTTAAIRMLGFNLGMYERTRITHGKQTVEVCANRRLERALEPRPAPPPAIEPRLSPLGRGGRRDPGLLTLPDEVSRLPISPAARLQQMADDIVSAMDFMTALFGPPPLPTITVSPAPGVAGQGFPGMIYLSTLSYLGPNDRPVARLAEREKVFFFDMLSAHEVAHQWWGNVVASSGYQSDWLLEALADYSALLYLEKRKGPRALESVLNNYRIDLLKKQEDGSTLESAGPIALGLRLLTSKAPEAWRVIAYEKGSWIMHMVRRRMGDERFLSFLGELRRRFEWKALDIESFRLVASEFLPPRSPDPKMESFFDQWVYSTGIPTLSLKYTLSGKAPALKLTVTVEQSGVDEDFSAPVPVEIQFGRLKPVARTVRTSNEPAVFTIPVRQAPTKVLLDPGGSLLAVRK